MIQKEKIVNFGKTPVNLHDHMQVVPMKIVQSNADGHDYELIVSGTSFTELLKRAKRIKAAGQQYVDLNAPITDEDYNCDYSGLNMANQQRLVNRILDASKAIQSS